MSAFTCATSIDGSQRSTLAAIGTRVGREALRPSCVGGEAGNDPSLYRKLIARKFDGAKHRRYPGRPTVGPKINEWVVRMARENSGCGYDRIAGALKNLGHQLSDQTVGNILCRFGIA